MSVCVSKVTSLDIYQKKKNANTVCCAENQTIFILQFTSPFIQQKSVQKFLLFTIRTTIPLV